MNISLAAEPVLHLFGLSITNSVLTGWVVSIVFLLVAILVRVKLQKKPSRGQTMLELVCGEVFAMIENVVGRADIAAELFPFIVTAFLFIMFSNWSGLLPGFGSILVKSGGDSVPLFRAPTTDLNMVIALALISVTYVQYLGVKYRGAKKYLHTFFNFSSPIYFFVGIIELFSEFTRIISYSFRLFGNIFAGEVLLTVMLYLTSSFLPFVPVLPLPFLFLETFVGFIQAFVFCFLTIVFTSIAVANHDESHAASEVAVTTTA